jgi:hypothetical protein
MGLRAWGAGFNKSGKGTRVDGLGFRVQGTGCEGFEFRGEEGVGFWI